MSQPLTMCQSITNFRAINLSSAMLELIETFLTEFLFSCVYIVRGLLPFATCKYLQVAYGNNPLTNLQSCYHVHSNSEFWTSSDKIMSIPCGRIKNLTKKIWSGKGAKCNPPAWSHLKQHVEKPLCISYAVAEPYLFFWMYYYYYYQNTCSQKGLFSR